MVPSWRFYFVPLVFGWFPADLLCDFQLSILQAWLLVSVWYECVNEKLDPKVTEEFMAMLVNTFHPWSHTHEFLPLSVNSLPTFSLNTFAFPRYFVVLIDIIELPFLPCLSYSFLPTNNLSRLQFFGLFRFLFVLLSIPHLLSTSASVPFPPSNPLADLLPGQSVHEPFLGGYLGKTHWPKPIFSRFKLRFDVFPKLFQTAEISNLWFDNAETKRFFIVQKFLKNSFWIWAMLRCKLLNQNRLVQER